MRNVNFQQDQLLRVNEPHVKVLNELVAKLSNANGRFMPRVAPHWGGTAARVLILMSDPGVGTNPSSPNRGSGFLSSENDDDAAERMAELLDTANLPTNECVGWNTYPWYIRDMKGPMDELSAKQMDEGVIALGMFVRLLPRLRVALLCGGAAHLGWEMLTDNYSRGLSERLDKIVALQTRSTGPGAFRSSDKEQIKAWHEEQVNTFHEARRIALDRG